MRLSYQWLCEYVDIRDVSPSELAEKLTSVGLEVESIDPRNQGVQGVVVGEVLACEKHPNADKLNVCQVNVGKGEPLTIVCGAPNVRAGQRVPVAVPGSNLPGGKIGKAKLRGVESNGMLCSAKEIGLEVRLLPKEQTEGLYILPADAPIGEDIVTYLHLDDVVLEIGLTPNRSDCLSMRGLAYEVAAIYNRTLQFHEEVEKWSAEPSPLAVKLLTPRCTRYDAQVLDGVQNGESPIWMQMRLCSMGVRPISLIVDVTNYVMLEWGQPLHAFDFDEIAEHMIVVRDGETKETLITLDGETRELDRDTIVIADPQKAIGIAGVMGGGNSEVRAKTRTIVLESAQFDARSVRRTGARLGLRSEAQQRFEKGIDVVAVDGALSRATALLTKLGHGNATGAVVRVENQMRDAAVTIPFSPERCNRRLGTNISAAQMLEIFMRLRFQVEGDVEDSLWTVLIPTRRKDISIEADLTEEIARLYGIDSIPSELPVGKTTAGVLSPAQRFQRRTREVLVASGMTEVVTYAFTNRASMAPLRQDGQEAQMIGLMHPLSEERSHLRIHMLPSLAEVAVYNLARGVHGGQIFELGRVYLAPQGPLTGQPKELTKLAALWFGETEPQLGERARSYDFYDAKGAVETWLDAMGWLAQTEFRRAERPWLHPGRTAEIIVSGTCVGYIGELHPETAAGLDLSGALYAEVDLDSLNDELSSSWKVESLPKFPASRRDLAILVNRDVAVADLLNTAKTVARESRILESIWVFDVYTGKGIPETHKSVAMALVYRADDRTLTDEEITHVETQILEAWTTQFEATLRSRS